VRTIEYRPEIDGLRSVAVAAVVLFHLRLGWLPGGFLGVDVFFVISGYLITSIVLRDLARGQFRFRDFWARRVRRITPALLVMVAATLATVAVTGFRGLRPEMGAQGLAALLSVANVYFFRETGNYWGPQAENAPFLHTWSLSVEEQFYVLLPVTLFLIHRKWPRAILPALALVLLGSFGVFLVEHTRHPSATFYLLPTRAWELAVGCLLARLPSRGTTSYARGTWLTGVGLALIVGSYFLVTTLNVGSAAAVVGAAMVLAFSGNGAFKTVLASKPFVYLGRISYSLYLWHWPLIVLPGQLDRHLSRPATVALMLAAAIASYHLVEQPARRARGIVPASLLALGAAAAVAFGMARSSGLYDISRFHKIDCYTFYFDLKPNNFEETRFKNAQGQMNCFPRQAPADAYLSGGIIVGPRPQSPQIVVLGDSHGTMWSNTIRQITERRGLTTSFYSMGGVSPFFQVPIVKDQSDRFVGGDVKYRFDLARLQHIQAWKPDVVVVAMRWSNLQDEAVARSTLDFLHTNAKQVLLLGQPPELAFGDRFAAEQLCYLGVRPEKDRELFLPVRTDDEYTGGEARARKLAAAYDNVTFVPTAQVFAKGDRALVLREGDVVYLDDDHLSDYGAHLASDVLAAAFDRAYARIQKPAGRNDLAPVHGTHSARLLIGSP
jgi:peptidoglycan/LPS O-acetylase OafA/YrhL